MECVAGGVCSCLIWEGGGLHRFSQWLACPGTAVLHRQPTLLPRPACVLGCSRSRAVAPMSASLLAILALPMVFWLARVLTTLCLLECRRAAGDSHRGL